MIKEHNGTISKIKEGGGGDEKTLIERMNMHNGCVSQYLKQERKWEEVKDLKYQEYKLSDKK